MITAIIFFFALFVSILSIYIFVGAVVEIFLNKELMKTEAVVILTVISCILWTVFYVLTH